MANRVELLAYPGIEWSPAGTLRKFSRLYKVLGDALTVENIAAEVQLPYGTVDEEHADAFLVAQRVEKTSERGEEMRLARTYQQLAAAALTETGEDQFVLAWDRRTIWRKVYLCKASEAESLLPAIGAQLGATGYYCFNAQIEDAGFAARVVVSYVGLESEFIIATSTDRNADGVDTLTIRSIILEKDVPGLTPVSGPDQSLDWTLNDGVAVVARKTTSIATPLLTSTKTETKYRGALTLTTQAGVGPTGGAEPAWTASGTLFETSVEIRGNVTYYRKSWAGGSGEIARDTETRFGGVLTVTTIRSIGASRVAATGEFDFSEEDRDGYTLWTSRGATGAGTIEDTTRTANNGALTLRTIRAVGAAPSSPGAGYVLVDDDSEQREGFAIHRRQWALGTGEISRASETRQGGKLTLVRVRHLSGPDITINPVASPGAGYVLFDSEVEDREGHRLWTSAYAKGAGRVESSVRYRQNAKLVVTTVRFLETDDGATPAGTLVDDQSEERDGYTLVTRTYAAVPGDGLVIDESETRNNGRLKLYRRVRLGSAPTTPSATIGGTVVSIAVDVRQEEGVTLYDYRWAEGIGTINTRSTFRQTSTDPEEIRREVQSLATVPATPAGFWLQVQASREESGATLYDYTFASLTAISSDSTEQRMGGTLQIRQVRSESAMATPAGWTLVEEGTTVREDGKTIFNYTFVLESDAMLVSEHVETRQGGNLIITRRRQLETAPSAPSAGIGGSVVLVDERSSEENGYTVFERTWAEGYGRVALDSEVRQGGKLSISTVRYLGADDGAPPAGVVIETSSEERDGHLLVTKRYANGAGRVSTETRDRQGGKLQQVSIRYLGADDGATPAGTLLSDETEQRDGHTLTTRVYVAVVGDGLTLDETETRENGRLKIYRRIRLGSAPATPAATIGGVVSLISAEIRQEDGVGAYSYRWAEGAGTVETHSTNRQTPTGTEEIRRQVRALAVAPSQPLGFWTQVQRTIEQDGVTQYDYTFVSETALSSDSTATRYNGALQVREVRSEAVVATPAGWTKTEEGTTIREDGKTIYNYRFVLQSDAAFIFESVETRENGRLRITRRRQLESAPSAPAAALGGTVALIEDSSRAEDGFTIYDRVWAEGVGTIEDASDLQRDGRTIRYQRTSLASPPAAPGSTFGGEVVLFDAQSHERDGVTEYRYVWMEEVGSTRRSLDENGRKVIEEVTVLLAGDAYTPGVVGAATATGDVTCVLVEEHSDLDAIYRRVRRRFAQATSTLAQLGADSIDTELNGLRRRTQVFIGTTASADPAYTVGTTTHGSDTSLILASLKSETSGSLKRVTLVYLQPGILSKSVESGPASLPNTLRHRWRVWETLPSMPGIVTATQTENFAGFNLVAYESLSLGDGTSTPIATLATYRDNVRVVRPGEVRIAKHTFGTGKEVPYLVTTPPTTGLAEMAVTVALVTTPPTSIEPTAFNLSALAVGVCFKRIVESPLGYDEGETISVSVYTDRASASYETLRGYYYTDPDTLNNVAVQYIYYAQVIRDNDNIIGEALTATETNIITLSGSTGYAAPASGDVYEKRVEPVFTLPDGTQVYRVVTYQVP